MKDHIARNQKKNPGEKKSVLKDGRKSETWTVELVWYFL